MITIKELFDITRKKTTDLQRSLRKRLMETGYGKSNLIKNIKIKTKLDSDIIRVEVDIPEYAVFVDKGRRPGKQPPLNVIQKWCKRKGIEREAAYPIAYMIGKRGLKGNNFLDPLRHFRDEIYPAMVREFKKAYTLEIKDKNITIK